MTTLNDRIETLERLLHEQPENLVARFEDTLAGVAALADPASIGPLVALLDDAVDDELMFSVVHTIEVFDDPIYVQEVLASLPELWRRAPRWAVILHIRIINSAPTFAAYQSQLDRLGDDGRSALKGVLEALTAKYPPDKHPQFTDARSELERRMGEAA